MTPRDSVSVHQLHAPSVGDDFSISVAACGPDPQATLVVTDAAGLFGTAVDTVRMMQLPGIVPSMLVVGVGYPGADLLVDTIQIRARDLTPTKTSVFEYGGGASDFAQFLHQDLRSWLRDRYPAAVDDMAYFGHSLGGLFGAFVMLTNHEVFDRYIISSPSLWWDERLLFQQEAIRAERLGDLATTAFFGIGGLETNDGRRLESINLADDHPAKAASDYLDMVEDMRLFLEQLRSRDYPSLAIESVVIVDEFHATVPGIVLNRALRHFWLRR